MTTTINGTTGVSLIQDGVVVQADLAANVAGNGPAFAATSTADYVLGTGSIAQNYGTELFDTANAFDSNKFQPPMPGYYLAACSLRITGAGTVNYIGAAITKNGSVRVAESLQAPYASLYGTVSCSGLVYLNGTTDYLQFTSEYSSTTVGTIRAGSMVSASLVRAA